MANPDAVPDPPAGRALLGGDAGATGGGSATTAVAPTAQHGDCNKASYQVPHFTGKAADWAKFRKQAWVGPDRFRSISIGRNQRFSPISTDLDPKSVEIDEKR